MQHTHTHASTHAVLKNTSSDTMISGLLKSTDFRKEFNSTSTEALVKKNAMNAKQHLHASI